MLGLQMLRVVTQLAVVKVSISVNLDDVDAVSCLTAKRHCLSGDACRHQLDSIHDVCGDNSKLPALSLIPCTSHGWKWELRSAGMELSPFPSCLPSFLFLPSSINFSLPFVFLPCLGVPSSNSARSVGYSVVNSQGAARPTNDFWCILS